MNVERRLHHAARALREVPVEAPDFEPRRRVRKLVGATAPLVAVAFAVLSGVAILAAESPSPLGDAGPAVAELVTVDAPISATVAPTPTGADEVVLINSLGSSATASLRGVHGPPNAI